MSQAPALLGRQLQLQRPFSVSPPSLLKIVIVLALTFAAVPALVNFQLLFSLRNNIEPHYSVRDEQKQADTPKVRVGSGGPSTSCLDLSMNEEMDSLLASARQVFITMLPKAGGSSVVEFARICNKQDANYEWGFLSQDKVQKHFLVNSLRVPPVIASHLTTEEGLIRLAKHPSRETLMIYIHREEGERVFSGIKQVASHICNNNDNSTPYKNIIIQKNSTKCVLDEGLMVDQIARRHREIGDASSHKMLTCNSYKKLHENAPRLVFLNYKQLDRLLILVAKNHCPEMLSQLPVKKNVAENKIQTTVLSSPVIGMVDIDKWLQEKGPALEWALNLRRDASCQAKTFHMEEDLFACPDQALRVTPEAIERW